MMARLSGPGRFVLPQPLPARRSEIMGSRTAALLLTSGLLAATLGGPAAAVETDLRYPAKVTITNGTIYHFDDLRHELTRGSFVLYDGETEGRVPWRDIDRITFVGNIGYGPGSLGPERPGTRRVRIRYVDGHERLVNLVVGRVRGFDGRAERDLPARKVTVIDFDEARIAPALYKACERGHVWEQADFRFCPFDGQELQSYRVDGVAMR
jgi:hypothetical protein